MLSISRIYKWQETVHYSTIFFFLEHVEAELLACIYSDLPDINKQGPLGESHWIIKSAD